MKSERITAVLLLPYNPTRGRRQETESHETESHE
jgi:hypothetical protein